MNTMNIGGYEAVITFDPDIQMFRGEFVGLNGGADFYAADVAGLRREGEVSLRVCGASGSGLSFACFRLISFFDTITS